MQAWKKVLNSGKVHDARGNDWANDEANCGYIPKIYYLCRTIF
jgi:hypothetical protein